jgi:hypothetical protein
MSDKQTNPRSQYKFKNATSEFEQFHNDNEPHQMLEKARELGRSDVGILYCGRNRFSSAMKLPRYFHFFEGKLGVSEQQNAASELFEKSKDIRSVAYCSREQSLSATSVSFQLSLKHTTNTTTTTTTTNSDTSSSNQNSSNNSAPATSATSSSSSSTTLTTLPGGSNVSSPQTTTTSPTSVSTTTPTPTIVAAEHRIEHLTLQFNDTDKQWHCNELHHRTLEGLIDSILEAKKINS